MTERLAHRDLRNRSSQILREVRDGATYEITNHGVVVAVMSPPLDARQVDLRVRHAQCRGGFGTLPRVRRSRPTAESLDALRDDR